MSKVKRGKTGAFNVQIWVRLGRLFIVRMEKDGPFISTYLPPVMILRDMTSVYSVGSGLCSIMSHNSSLLVQSQGRGTRPDNVVRPCGAQSGTNSMYVCHISQYHDTYLLILCSSKEH
jgi:hypothetical protein